MSIATFLELRTAVSSWLNRTDLTTAQLKDFVTLAEGDMRNDLETREGQILLQSTMTGDGFSAPVGYLTARTLVVGGTFYEYLTPEAYAKKVDQGITSGYYTINGDVFSVLGGDGQDYELMYMGTVTALSADGDSNWILENAPNVYLWGACKYGSAFLRDVTAVTGFDSLYKEAVSALNAIEKKSKWGGPLVVRPETVTP